MRKQNIQDEAVQPHRPFSLLKLTKFAGLGRICRFVSSYNQIDTKECEEDEKNALRHVGGFSFLGDGLRSLR